MDPKRKPLEKLWLSLFLAGCALFISTRVLADATDIFPKSAAPAFSVTADAEGKYWFVDPHGNRFLSIGINNIIPEPFRPRPDTRYYAPIPDRFADIAAWKQDVFKMLGEHGFNTLGAWSNGQLYDGPLYGTVCLYVVGHAADRCLDGLRPGFERRVRENTEFMLEQYPYRENIFGVFLDNEMPWYGHAPWGDIPNYTLLELALSQPEEDDARRAAIAFLKERYADPETLSKAWGKPLASWEALTFEYARSCVTPQTNEDRKVFIELAAEAFYKTAVATVRQMLPGKLILGTRYAAYAPEPVIRACGRYCDVISFNDYRSSPAADAEMLARYWIWGGKKPLMITEFSWRAEENTSGNPNTGGAGDVVRTQAQRAENYQRYVEDLLAYPMVVGAHWFEFADQSPEGRFDGENSNYGIVDIQHRPYTELLDAMKRTHSRVAAIHAESDRQSPVSLPRPRPVIFRPGQRPERPPVVDLLKAPIKGMDVFHAPDANVALEMITDCLLVSIDTANEWGCGVLFYGPEQFEAAGVPYATNLDGYSAIELDARVGKHTLFDVFLEEAGVGPPDAAAYNTAAGDDGESFVFPANQGTGNRFVYRFELKDLQPRKDWGNQKGLRIVDTHAMKGVVLFFHGGQGRDTMRVYSLKLVR
jgi:agarase